MTLAHSGYDCIGEGPVPFRSDGRVGPDGRTRSSTTGGRGALPYTSETASLRNSEAYPSRADVQNSMTELSKMHSFDRRQVSSLSARPIRPQRALYQHPRIESLGFRLTLHATPLLFSLGADIGEDFHGEPLGHRPDFRLARNTFAHECSQEIIEPVTRMDIRAYSQAVIEDALADHAGNDGRTGKVAEERRTEVGMSDQQAPFRETE